MTVTRFAPSPTGLLHLGHAYSALFAWRAARANGGNFLLRIEDIDRGRCRPEFEAAIIEDMTWIGIDWNGPVRRQSEHFDDYRAALDKLDEAGLIYPCFCTRREIRQEIDAIGGAPHGPDGPIYPGTCRGLEVGERTERIAGGLSYALRLDMVEASKRAGPLDWIDRERGRIPATPQDAGDIVMARKDSPTSYHLSVTVDDALQGVTLVTRGVDLFPATHIHRLLQALLGLETPEYQHHRLLTDSAGQRFAKRDRSRTIQRLRESGFTPPQVLSLAEA